MECVLDQLLSNFDVELLKDFVVSNDVQQPSDPTHNCLLDVVYKASLAQLEHSATNTKSCRVALQTPITILPLDLRIRKVVKIASFAKDLASQPNIISKETKKKAKEHVISKAQKNMKKERLIEAKKRLKQARKSWKSRPD